MRKIYVLLHDAKKMFSQALAALMNQFPDSRQRTTTLLYPTALYTESKPEFSKSNMSQMQTFTNTNKAFKGFNRWMISLVTMLLALTFSMNVNAQLTGTKNIPGDYPDLASAITDLNTLGVGAGGVTINLSAGNPQTTPSGGYSITTLSGSLANPIIINGNSNVITAFTPQVAGSKNDAFFKIIGGDYVTIQGFTMNENTANTVAAVATNTMTEWGVGLFAASATDGAQNNTIQNNTINLSNVTTKYQNAVGVFSSSASSVTNGAVAATSIAGTNSNNKFYTNIITGVAQGFYFLSPAQTATVFESGNDIGGTSAGQGNNITFGYVATAGDLGYTSYSGATAAGIYFRNVAGNSARFNTITNSLAANTLPMGGIFTANGTAPAGITYTTTFSNNSITLTTSSTAAVTGIEFAAGLATGTIAASSNTIIINQNSTAAVSAALIGIKANYTSAGGTFNANNITVNQAFAPAATATNSSAVTALTLPGAVVNATSTVNALNNTVLINKSVTAGSGITGTVSGTILGIQAASADSVLNIGSVGNSNTITIKEAAVSGAGTATYSSTITFIDAGTTHRTANIVANNLNTTGSTIRSTGTTTMVACSATVTALYNIKSNTAAIDRVAASGTIQFTNQTGTPSNVADTVSANTITYTNLAGTTIATGISQLGGPSTSGLKSICNNVINISGTNTGTTTGIAWGYSGGARVIGNSITINCAAATLLGLNPNNTSAGGGFFTPSSGPQSGIPQLGSISLNSISLTSSSTTPTSMIGINAGTSGAGPFKIFNNTFTTLNFSGIITGSPVVSGIVCSAGTADSIFSNVVTNISVGAATSTATPVVDGILVGGGTSVNVFKNKIYGITTAATGTTTAVNGIRISGGTTNNVYNNLIGDLTAPAAASTDALRGISITSTTTSSTQNISFNTVYLNGSSTGANFGSSGIFHTISATATTSTLNLRNNIIVNASTPVGTGLTVAYRRSAGAATNLANYGSTSNKNDFYTPSGTGYFLYNDGTSNATAIAAYQAGVFTAGTIAPRDAASFSENPTFLSTAGANANFLHIDPSVSTLIESGADVIAGITDDYDAQTRSVTKPDVGADEFAGTSPAPVISGVSAITTACIATAHTITANIVPTSGTLTTVTLNYNNGAAGSVTMTGPAGGGTFSGTIPAAAPTNATVSWSITAFNTAGVSTLFSGTSYADEPLTGVTAAATASTSPICAGSPTNLTASLAKLVSTPLGAGATTSGSSGGSFFPGSWGGAKTQYIIRASELTALGYGAGSLTSLAFEPTTSGQTYTGFAVSLGLTNASTAAFPMISTGLTQVYSGTGTNNGFTPVANVVNTLTFGTGGTASSFFWDGTSNLVVSICWSSVPSATTSTSTTMKTDVLGYTCTVSGQSDSQTPSALCGFTASASFGTTNSTGNNRPRFTFTGNAAPAITSVTWDNGAGTGNPVTVSPGTTTTYQATISAAGCTTSASVVVNVNALPAAPGSGTFPSFQCGNGVPAEFVNGALPGQYRWYTVATGGTALSGETAASLTAYTINTTTDFWVSINNGTCEGPRTQVTANVISPDAVTAHASSVSSCLGSGIDLSVTQTGNNQNYAYTWSATPAAGSGIPTTVAGAPVTGLVNVVPTAVGTYIYHVSAADGPCSTTSTISVTVNALPVIDSIKALPATICAGTSTVLSVYSAGGGFVNGPQTQPTGYLAATFSSTTEDDIGQVTFGTINNPAVRPTPQQSNANAVNTYTDYTSVAPTTVTPGLSYPITVYHFHSTTDASANFCNVYIDFNRDGDFLDAGETISLSKPGATFLEDFVGTIPVPLTAKSGITRMRVVVKEGAITSSTGSIGTWGEAEDYLVNVLGVNPQNPTLTYSWDNGAGSLATTAAQFPAASTLYTATVLNTGTGCSNTAQVQVNVNPLPNAPTGTDADQCGNVVSTASVTSNSDATTPSFNWYSAPTGGTLLQSGTTGVTGTTGIYTTAVGVTTTFYVAEVSAAGCESTPRTPVTVTVATPDLLTATPSAYNICPNGSVDLVASYTPDFNSFATFTLTVDHEAGSGITNPVSLTPNATGSDPYTVSPTAVGTYIYTITAFDPDKGCTSADTIKVTLNPNPAISSFTALPSPICEGAALTLTAKTIVGGAGTAVIGNGTSSNTTTTTIGTLYGAYYGNGHSQVLYLASELTAAGVQPGNINTLGINISGVGSSQVLTGFTIKMAATAATSITTFQAPTFATVFGPVNYTPVLGVNTHTLASAFVWDGTSNIIVDYCFQNGITGTSAMTYINTYTTTAFGSFVNYQADGVLTSPCANTTVSNASSNRPNLIFGGTIGTNLTANNTWEFNPGNISGGTSGVATTTASLATTSYTVTASALGCSTTSAPVSVTVNPVPVAPTANPSTQCGIGVPTASVSGGAGTYKWYDAATGGNVIQRGGTTYTGSISATTHFYVSDSSTAGCEGPRVDLTAAVTAPPTLAITPSGATSFCFNGTIGLDALTASDPSYVNFTWSTIPVTGAGLSSTSGSSITATPTVEGTYTINLSANDGVPVTGCSNNTSISITVKPNPVISTATATPATVCSGGSASLVATSVGVAGGFATVGTATTTVSTSGNPYRSGNGTGNQIRTQLLITKAQMNAAGFTSATQLTSLAFNSTSTTGTFDNLEIQLGATTATALTSTFETSSMTSVFTAASYTPVVGLNTHVFTTPFAWDGNSNILINTCQTNNILGTTTLSAFTPATTSDNHQSGSLTGCSDLTGSTSSEMPTVRFGADNTGNYSWTWNPGALSGSTVSTGALTANASYTVTAVSNGCSTTSAAVSVTVQAVAAAPSAAPGAICVGGSSTLTANATGGGPFTYAWSDGTATVYPATASIAVSPAVTTTYSVIVTDACGNPTAAMPVTVTVNPLPVVSVNEASATICSPATYSLTTTTNAASPAYQWLLASTNIPAATASAYTVTSTGVYKVTVTDGVTGCVNTSAQVSVTINAQPAAPTVTPATASVCSGAAVALVASGGVTTVPGSFNVGTDITTTNTAGITPFNSNWEGSRTQYLVKASELTALGLSAGNITSLGFDVTAAGVGTFAQSGFSIKIANTADAALTTTAYGTPVGSFTTVYGPLAVAAPAVGIKTFTFSTPFVWDGTSNILVDICHDNDINNTCASCFSSSSTVKYTTTTFNSVFGRYNDNAQACGTNASTAITSGFTSRPNMIFGGSSVFAPVSYTWDANTTLSTTTGTTTTATPITPGITTYTVRAANSFGCSNAGTADITVTACSPVWTGATSTNWNTASNWSSNVVPSVIENVTIGTAGTGFYPVLTGNVTVGGTLTMASGTTITIGSNTLTLNGGVTPISAGVLVGSATSNLSVAGTAPLKFATGAGATLKNLTVTSGTTTLTSALDITGGTGGINSGTFGTVTVASGATLASAGFLTFKSNASGTARLASGNVTGDVTVERFIPANAKRAYRMLSIPTKGSQKIKAAWQEGGTNANFNPKPGFGTVITSNVGPSATMIANGFDQFSTATSIQRWNTATGAWVDITATQGAGTTGNIESLKGYSIYIRGDRTQLNTGTTTTATTLRTTGTLYIGNQAPIAIPANKFEMVGNTYVSAIDFALLTKANINGTLYIWDPKLPQSNGTLGGYVSFVAINGYTPSLTTGSYTAPNSVIESGQSFFVATGANPGTLTLTESAKVAGSRSDVFRPATAPQKLKANLYVVAADNSTIMADANVSVFDSPYSNAVDGDDGLKLSNAGENLSIYRDNKNLVVEGRQPVAEFDTTYFNMWNMSASRQYKLELVTEQMNIPGLSAYLVDSYLGTTTPLNMSGSIAYNFGISSSAPLSSASNRFKVVYRQVQLAPLPVTFVSISANKLGAAVKVDWKVAAERGIVRYEVERSADGSSFTRTGNVTATGNSSLDLNYSWMDATPLSGTNFYRIKSIGVAGDIKYTNIAKVSFGDVKPSYTIAPNPVEGSTVNLQFKNRVAGRYNVRLLSNAGQVIFTTIAEHAGGNSTQLISLPATIARGAYQIEIIAPDKTTEVQNLFINTTK